MESDCICQEELQSEAKYNSFILCQTKNIAISEKLPFIVTTKKGRITKPTLNQDSCQDFQCNYSFNSFSYLINAKRIILAQGAWIRPLLTLKQKSLMENYQIINFKTLEISNQVKFYFYHQKSKKFIQVYPKYLIISDCIIFQQASHIIESQFRPLNLKQQQTLFQKLQKSKNYSQIQLYHFESQYAIMSDIHFLASFVRGYKPIGSYLKNKNQKCYFHLIDQIILRNLIRLYPSSNL